MPPTRQIREEGCRSWAPEAPPVGVRPTQARGRARRFALPWAAGGLASHVGSLLAAALLTALWVIASPFAAAARAPQAAGTAPPSQSSSSNQESPRPAGGQIQPPFTLKVQRNLVLVRVVVRDAHGNLVDGLKQRDFRILDNGKAQEITDFSIIRTAARPSPEPSTSAKAPSGPPAPSGQAPLAPQFVALYFDDIHMEVDSAVPVCEAAQKFLVSSWRPGDFAGVFTATGQTEVGFTSDLSKVQQAVAQIMARPRSADENNDCPDITPYQSYLIAEAHDPTAENIADLEAYQCDCHDAKRPDPACARPATEMVRAIAYEDWNNTRDRSRATLEQIGRLIEVMAKLPGERTLAFVSPGLITASSDGAVGKLIELAIRNRVTVNSLDARGLFVLSPEAHVVHLVDAPLGAIAEKQSMIHTESVWAEAPLSDLAEGTGGTFFHNDNDFVSGFKQVTSPPQVLYLLGFSPNDFKPNGAYHSLKVQITSAGKYEIQARRGYLAPTKIEETQQAQAAPPDPIEMALYAGESSQAFPIGLHAESSRTPNGPAMLSVSVHVEIQQLFFQQQQDHYVATLIFRTALFDPHQQYVTGDERNLVLNLDEKKFADLARSGINAVTHLAVAPGDYVLREVVEEKTTGKLSALSQPVQVQ